MKEAIKRWWDKQRDHLKRLDMDIQRARQDAFLRDTLTHIDRVANAKPYDMQRLDGVEGPAREVWSQDRLRKRNFSVRPMVELITADGQRNAVPLPTPRGPIRKYDPDAAYQRVNDSPLYAEYAWAHEALKHLAHEYDEMQVSGMKQMFLAFHAQKHRLVISELDPRKIFNPPGMDIGPGTATACSVPLADQNLLIFSSEKYQRANREMDGNVLVHELTHALDENQGYSNHVLFERALLTDILNSKPGFLSKLLGRPLFTQIKNEYAYGLKKLNSEIFAEVAQLYASYPDTMRQAAPAMTQYLTDIVLPDVSCRRMRSGASLLEAATDREEWLEVLRSGQTFHDSMKPVLEALCQRSEIKESDSTAMTRAVHDLRQQIVYIHHSFEGESLPQEVSENFRELVEKTRKTMLRQMGATAFPGASDRQF